MEDKKQNHEGLRLKQFRKEKGISQAELASLLDCSQPNLSKIERGELGISSALRELIFANFPSLSPNWLFAGTGVMEFKSYDTNFVHENFFVAEAPRAAYGYFEEFKVLIEEGKVPNQVIAIIYSDLIKMYRLQCDMFDALKKNNEVLLETCKANTALLKKIVEG